jgi:hypothetical protein
MKNPGCLSWCLIAVPIPVGVSLYCWGLGTGLGGGGRSSDYLATTGGMIVLAGPFLAAWGLIRIFRKASVPTKLGHPRHEDGKDSSRLSQK